MQQIQLLTFTGCVGSTKVASATPTGEFICCCIGGSQSRPASYTRILPSSARAARKIGGGVMSLRAIANQCWIRGCGGT